MPLTKQRHSWGNGRERRVIDSHFQNTQMNGLPTSRPRTAQNGTVSPFSDACAAPMPRMPSEGARSSVRGHRNAAGVAGRPHTKPASRGKPAVPPTVSEAELDLAIEQALARVSESRGGLAEGGETALTRASAARQASSGAKAERSEAAAAEEAAEAKKVYDAASEERVRELAVTAAALLGGQTTGIWWKPMYESYTLSPSSPQTAVPGALCGPVVGDVPDAGKFSFFEDPRVDPSQRLAHTCLHGTQGFPACELDGEEVRIPDMEDVAALYGAWCHLSSGDRSGQRKGQRRSRLEASEDDWEFYRGMRRSRFEVSEDDWEYRMRHRLGHMEDEMPPPREEEEAAAEQEEEAAAAVPSPEEMESDSWLELRAARASVLASVMRTPPGPPKRQRFRRPMDRGRGEEEETISDAELDRLVAELPLKDQHAERLRKFLLARPRGGDTTDRPRLKGWALQEIKMMATMRERLAFAAKEHAAHRLIGTPPTSSGIVPLSTRAQGWLHGSIAARLRQHLLAPLDMTTRTLVQQAWPVADDLGPSPFSSESGRETEAHRQAAGEAVAALTRFRCLLSASQWEGLPHSEGDDAEGGSESDALTTGGEDGRDAITNPFSRQSQRSFSARLARAAMVGDKGSVGLGDGSLAAVLLLELLIGSHPPGDDTEAQSVAAIAAAASVAGVGRLTDHRLTGDWGSAFRPGSDSPADAHARQLLETVRAHGLHSTTGDAAARWPAGRPLLSRRRGHGHIRTPIPEDVQRIVSQGNDAVGGDRSPEALALQAEALWLLINLTGGGGLSVFQDGSGSQRDGSVVNDSAFGAALVLCAGLLPVLLALLASRRLEVVEKAAWVLGNIAGAGIPARDAVIASHVGDVLASLIEMVCSAVGAWLARYDRGEEDSSKHPVPTPPAIVDRAPNLLAVLTWSLGRLCEGLPRPGVRTDTVMPALARVLALHADEGRPFLSAATHAAWIVSNLCDGSAYDIRFAIARGILPHLIGLLSPLPHDWRVCKPALRAIGNIVCAEDETDFTDLVVRYGAVPRLGELAAHESREIQKEACWTLSNIAAGTESQIRNVIESGALPTLVKIALNPKADPGVKTEAGWVMLNATSCGTEAQVPALVHAGCVRVLCSLIGDSSMGPMATEGLDKVLRVGQHLCSLSDQLVGEVEVRPVPPPAVGLDLTVPIEERDRRVLEALLARALTSTVKAIENPPEFNTLASLASLLAIVMVRPLLCRGEHLGRRLFAEAEEAAAAAIPTRKRGGKLASLPHERFLRTVSRVAAVEMRSFLDTCESEMRSVFGWEVTPSMAARPRGAPEAVSATGRGKPNGGGRASTRGSKARVPDIPLSSAPAEGALTLRSEMQSKKALQLWAEHFDSCHMCNRSRSIDSPRLFFCSECRCMVCRDCNCEQYHLEAQAALLEELEAAGVLEEEEDSGAGGGKASKKNKQSKRRERVRKKQAAEKAAKEELEREAREKSAREQEERIARAAKEYEAQRIREAAELEVRMRREEEEKRRLALEQEEKRRLALEQEEKRRLALEQEEKRRLALEQEEKHRLALERALPVSGNGLVPGIATSGSIGLASVSGPPGIASGLDSGIFVNGFSEDPHGVTTLDEFGMGLSSLGAGLPGVGILGGDGSNRASSAGRSVSLPNPLGGGWTQPSPSIGESPFASALFSAPSLGGSALTLGDDDVLAGLTPQDALLGPTSIGLGLDSSEAPTRSGSNVRPLHSAAQTASQVVMSLLE
jgi:hypothetical protein